MNNIKVNISGECSLEEFAKLNTYFLQYGDKQNSRINVTLPTFVKEVADAIKAKYPCYEIRAKEMKQYSVLHNVLDNTPSLVTAMIEASSFISDSFTDINEEQILCNLNINKIFYWQNFINYFTSGSFSMPGHNKILSTDKYAVTGLKTSTEKFAWMAHNRYPITKNHKYLITCEYNNGGHDFLINLYNTSNNQSSFSQVMPNTKTGFVKYAAICNASATGDFNLLLYPIFDTVTNTEWTVRNVQIYDLTEMFGQEEADRIFADGGDNFERAENFIKNLGYSSVEDFPYCDYSSVKEKVMAAGGLLWQCMPTEAE